MEKEIAHNRIKKGELTEKELQNPRLLLVGIKNKYIDNDGINANVDWNSITSEEDEKLEEARVAANDEIIAAHEEFKKEKIRKEGKKVENMGGTKEVSEEIDNIQLEKMLEGIDSQGKLINFCEENRKISIVSGDGTHHYLPSRNRLEELFSGKINWRELSIVPLRRKIVEIARAKSGESDGSVVENVARPSEENPPVILKENLEGEKLTQAEFEQKYKDVLGINSSDEKGENWMYVYRDGYDENTGKAKIFLQKGSEEGASKRYSLDELDEFLKVYTKIRSKGEKMVPKKSEKKIILNQEGLDAFEASSQTNGNRRVYDANSTPDDAREAGIEIKNLKKIQEQKKAEKEEKKKEEKMDSEVRAFVEASAEEGKKWRTFLESEKGRSLFGGDEKILREKVEHFVADGLKWYADFSEKDKKFAIEETMKKIFS